MSTEGTYEDATHEVDGEEPIEVGDLLDDPRTDAEALCLCALLWSPADIAETVSALLSAGDFTRVAYGELFEAIATQVRSGAPHDPASIASALTQGGKTAGHHGEQLVRALTQATMAGGPPEAAGHYAIAVVSAAYRRGFHTAAASMTEAAERLPQDALFEHLVTIGRAQRTATQRLSRISAALGQAPAGRERRDPPVPRRHRDRGDVVSVTTIQPSADED